VRSHLRTPLYLNSYALILSAAGTAALGLLYWAVAARRYPAAEVGIQSVLISTTLFLAGLSQLSLNSALLRYLPVAGRRAGRFIVASYGASVVAAIVAGSIFVIGTPFWSPKLTFLLHDPLWFAAFVVSTAVWCVYSLQDSVLTGLRRATWVPVENISVSGAKVLLLLAFSDVLVHSGLYASWMLPAAAAVVGVNLLLRRRVMPSLAAVPADDDHSARTIVRFAAGNYVGFVFYAAASNLLPLVVLNRSGATEAAYFFLPWTITSALLLVGASTATSLTVETARDLDLLASHARRTLIHTMSLLALPVAVLVVAGPTILNLLGPDYGTHGGSALRLFALGVIPNAVVLVGLGVMRLRGEIHRLAMLQALTCVILLGLSWALLPRYGITVVGLAFVLSQSLGAVIVLATDLSGVVRAPRTAS
jgi:O-antigen/teichoic acid export membrane protein